MKKIIATLATAAFAAGLFAVDFSATVQMEGSLAGGSIMKAEITPEKQEKQTYEDWELGIFTLDNKDQKDSDLLEIHFSGDKAGADFKFWAPASNSFEYDDNGTTKTSEGIHVRGMKLWLQPIDMIKVSVGNIGIATPFVEKIDYWKVPNGAGIKYNIDDTTNMPTGFAPGGYNDKLAVAADLGITVEANLPVLGGLKIGAGIAPGAGKGLLTGKFDGNDPDDKEENKFAVTSYGVLVSLKATDMITAALTWRDDGTDKNKYLAVGVGFDGGEALPLNAFVNGILRLDGDRNDATSKRIKYSVGISGLVIDNYLAYDLGFMKIEGTFPVTIRGLKNWQTDAEKELDASYMTAKLKVTVPIDSFSFGLQTGSYDAWILNKNFAKPFSIFVNPYVDFDIGVCSLSVGLNFGMRFMNYTETVTVLGKDYSTKIAGSQFDWSVPFTAKVSF